MKIVKVLSNNNQISSETAQEAFYPAKPSNLTFKAVFSGYETCDIGRRRINIFPGGFLILNEGTSFSSRIESDIPVNNLSISFDPAFVSDFSRAYESNDMEMLDNPFEVNRELRFCMETIYPFTGDIKYTVTHLRSHLENNVRDELLLNEYLHHCLINYYQIFNKEISAKRESLHFMSSATRDEILRRLNLAKDYMISNHHKNLNLDDIAQHACLSVNHLLRTFKQAFHLSPHQYLIRIRLERARHLLRSTAYPINDIVCIIGFECSSSFIRLFRNYYQLTPGQFRSNCLN